MTRRRRSPTPETIHDLRFGPGSCPACRPRRSEIVPVEEYGFIYAGDTDLYEPYWLDRVSVGTRAVPAGELWYTTQEVMEPSAVEHYRLMIRAEESFRVPEAGQDDEERWWVKDGHHRLAALLAEGVEPIVEDWE